MVLFAVPVALLAARALALAPREVPRLFPSCATFVALGILIFSPWFIRNFAWTRNPAFPEATSLFGRAHFTEVQAQRWTRAHSARPDQRSPVARGRAFVDQVLADWRYGYVAIPIGFMAFVVSVRGRREACPLLFMLVWIAIFWLFFTHLQGRFFVVAIPICALLVGLVEPKFSFAPIIVAAGIGISLVHARLAEFDRRVPLASLIALPRIEVLASIDLTQIPSDAQVVLIGDARAFCYDIPMSRLHYKTVFDVAAAPGETSVDAWRAGTTGLPKPVIEVIVPSELERFAKTYEGIPPPPPEVASREQPYLQWRP
jgi:hypothetical protein